MLMTPPPAPLDPPDPGCVGHVALSYTLPPLPASDSYFKDRQLYPNVDFYSGIIYKTMGFPTDMFPVLFTIPRVAGWLAHWAEIMEDPELKIFRPRQVYTGLRGQEYISVEDRSAEDRNLTAHSSGFAARRSLSHTGLADESHAIPKTAQRSKLPSPSFGMR
eukprot:TRINITY_DN2988_c0_g1_i2.p1 TRINITY_DN2988_c0_g1~~TRINITY_DN2988_c0_g1_i2.p1  ORF type:complete len:162 (+),score=13.94 TRINITY_DN2988_c0_g1_i2:178-663(+)